MKTPRASFSRTILALAISVFIFGCASISAPAERVLRVVPAADLDNMDPMLKEPYGLVLESLAHPDSYVRSRCVLWKSAPMSPWAST